MAFTTHFSAVDKAILVATGNSLVVCGSTTAPAVNTSGMICLDGTTTRDWTKSGSSANLNILTDSTILYAELVWYSTVYSNVAGALDLRSVEDEPITFTTSQGSYQITPKYTDTYTGISGSVDRYRAADVTNYVSAALSGSYMISNVPISVPSTGLSNSRGGWTLVVIYRNYVLKPQKIIYQSGIGVATQTTPLQTTITGFTTDSNSDYLKGNVCLFAANGEPLTGIQYVSVGPSFANLTNIGNTVYSPNSNPGTVPNNPGNSFFSGVINIANPLNPSNGLLNINGTNGSLNNDGFVPTQTLGGRNKWDITDVDISNTLIPNQTMIAGQLTASGTVDGIQLIGIGTQVLAQAPNITALLDMYDIDGDDENNVQVGEPLVLSVQIKNDGSVDANNFNLSTALDPSVSFVPNSVTVNNIAMPGANITTGVNIGTIQAHGVINVTFTVNINSVPTGPIVNGGGMLYDTVDYNYQFTSGQSTITNYATTNTISVIVQSGTLSISKLASKTVGNVGDTVTYTINISNTGTVNAVNMLLQDKVNQYCSFVSGSVIVSGDSNDYTDADPTVGIVLPNLGVGESTQIVFQVKINLLPASTKISNSASISFGYMYNQYGYLREKTTFSNSTSIQIQFIDVVGERCNNNNYPTIGSSVTYTLSLTDIGNIPATNVQILEPSITGATFVSGSVMINGMIDTTGSLNPFTGFILSNPINPQQTTTVSYKVLVNQINPSDVIENIAQVPFKYQIVPGGTVTSTEKDSNIVDTVANYVCMNISETVDKAYATIGDTLYYTVNISNSGNINAINTRFLSNIQAETSFIAGSVGINGILYPAYNPQTGFSIGVVCPGNDIQVTFQSKVNSIPNPNIVYNYSNLGYSYLPDPNGSTLTDTINSNTVQTVINKAVYTVTKSVDKMYAQLGDPLVYTTTIQNTGTVTLYNNVFADYIGAWISLYNGTVYINGVNYPNYDPSEGFPIDDIHPGDTITITFAVTIVKNPPVGYIPNTSEVIINYQENPTSPVVTKTVYSNTVKTYDPTGTLALVKSVDKAYATVGDTLTYSFTATNTGTTAIVNTFFTDIIQSQASFVPGSVYENGTNQPTYDPTVGFKLGTNGTLNVGQVVTVSFQVTVNILPVPNVIKNSATASFSYYVDPNNQPITKNTTSNTVTTVINTYSATLTKAVDKAYATIGDILNYTVTANNTGTVYLNNVSFKDIIPSGATFVTGSVILDGTSQPNYNPNAGFISNNVAPGGSSVVQFQATVTSVPNPAQIKNTANINFQYTLNPSVPYTNGTLTSNTTTTNINKMAVTNTKSVDKMYATVGDILTYTSVIANNGNINISNTNFIDTAPAHTTFVPGSVIINGVSQSNDNPNTGFTLGTIAPGLPATVVFQVSVDSVPGSGYVTNSSIINYQYYINPNESPLSSSITSNTVTTYINLGNITVTKSADRSIVRLTDTVTYNLVVSNTGNTTVKNLLFKDIIQSESSFITDSVYINGVQKTGYDPNIGFSLSDIPVGQQVTVSFAVTANSIPENNKLLNTATVGYSYYVDPIGAIITKAATSNTTTVYVYNTIISANKYVDKSIAKMGDTLNFTIDIYNSGNIPAQQVQFIDILDPNIKLVDDSVYINGTQKIGYDPSVGFSLSEIEPNTTTEVKFAATIVTRPANNIVYNFATINYQYTVGTDVTTATMNTNTTTTYVAVGELTLTKAVNKMYATVGDNLSYSVVVNNTGSVNATNLDFTDLMPPSTSFNAGTVVVDGTPQPTFDPTVGFVLSNLAPYQSHTVTFSINVNSLPTSGEVDNTANTAFTYKLTPADNPVTMTANSNTVTTYIKLGMLNLTKIVDKAYATIGNILNYSVTINNQGNANCSSVFFQDIIQSDATFVENSLQINGVVKSEYDPTVGFNLSDMPGYGSVVVTFQAKVVTVPNDDYIYNYATTNYSYYIDPANQPVVTSSKSNTVATMINLGSLTATKSVSKNYATIEDTVSYTVNIKNNGNVTANAVNFRDVVPNGLTLVPGSVSINGTLYPSYDPYASFTLGNIGSGNTIVVKFDTTVTSVPNPSLVSNTANLTFSYYINPTDSPIYAQFNSNTVTTQINLGSITIAKSVDKGYATHGDVLTYSVIVTNNGNVDAQNVNFTDDLQSDITFNAGTVTVNGITQSGYDPTVGFNLGTIPTLTSATVVFTVTVIALPTSPSVLNFAIGTFQYKIDPNGQYYNKSVQSNTVSTIIKMPSLTAAKTVDKIYATLQDTLNYSVLVTNTGNTTLTQLSFDDTLSNGAMVIAGSVLVNGVSYPTYDPIVGFDLPNLLAGNTALVQFQAKVTTLPIPPQVTNYATVNGEYLINPQGSYYPISTTSNTVTTNINLGTLSNAKTVDKMYASVNDTVTYTSTITNTGNVNATNIVFTDILQSALTYISGTVTINNVVYPSLDPTVGFSLSNLAPGQVVTVAFAAKINTLPTPAYVTNTSQIEFSYLINPTGVPIIKNQFSNTVTTNVVLGQINATKTVDKPIATVGDTLTYTVTLTNVGNVIDNNVLFQDTPSVGAVFKPGSVTVSGVSEPTYDPTAGFSLGDLGIGNVITVVFVATVVSVPPTNQVTNQAVIPFKYVVDPKQQPYSSTAYSNTVTTNIALGSLSVTKAVNKQFATIGDNLTYTVTIINTGNINATNVVFLDPTPTNSVFVLGSVTVNGLSQPTYNPSAGFNLNTMVPGQIITVVYQVKVINLC